MNFDTLPGFREFYPAACVRRNYIFEHWRNTAEAFNFQEYDAPILEPLDLYIEKSGEEIVGQLFNFEDRGGRKVAMRPEMTPSLARLVGAKANSLKRPIKWFNIGEHYRYERPQKGRLRAFYQYNVDLLGEANPSADAELIALLVESFKSFGLTDADYKIRLSDRDLWWLFLESEGMDGDTATRVLGIIDKMERAGREKSIEQLEPILGAAAANFMGKVESLIALRDFNQLRTFFESSVTNDALGDKVSARLNDWSCLLESLESNGAGACVVMDFGIVRGLAYYTGFVFEAFEASGEGRALAGGGRYDDLVNKLCGQAMPAVGFAMGDVTLTDLLEKKGLLSVSEPTPDFFMIIGGSSERAVAMGDAAKLRAAGYRVEYPLKELGFGKQFKDANQKGARFALIYGSDELEAGVLKVRDLQDGNEKNHARDDLVSLAEMLFEESAS
jgi:histidyl-tRNA synthetase